MHIAHMCRASQPRIQMRAHGGFVDQTNREYLSEGQHLFIPAPCWSGSMQASPFPGPSLSYPQPQALDKMEKEWSAILFNVLPYKETETYILKSPDEASQLLDDHIVMTQSMSFSPYKKPFEQRIYSWENKLKLTQVDPPWESLTPPHPCSPVSHRWL